MCCLTLIYLNWHSYILKGIGVERHKWVIDTTSLCALLEHGQASSLSGEQGFWPSERRDKHWSHTSKFSNTFYCKSHEGEVYFKKQSFTSVSSK